MIAPAIVRPTHNRFCHVMFAVPRASIENWMSTKSGEINVKPDRDSKAA